MMRHQPPGPPPSPAALAQPPALPPGTLLAGRYLIQGYIGGGGFGHIYYAQDRILDHRRAIKEAFYQDTQTQQQFRFEAEFLLNARHPNLVRGYAVFEQSARLYLVMDYVDGFTLEELAIARIRETGRPAPELEVLDWVIPICDALHELHQQPRSIIHRDVKPANIKLTSNGVSILIDLGLAKLYSYGSQTIGAALAFTPGYAPPEQYQASGATDQRTDIYGLGATLFYLLTGYQPTEAPARLSAHALPTPRSLNPSLTPLTELVVLKAMSLDPAQRQQDALTLKRELLAARQEILNTLSRHQPTPPAAFEQERHLVCVRCGSANPAGARFCLRCGSPVTAPQAAHPAADLQLIARHTPLVHPAPAALDPPAPAPALDPVPTPALAPAPLPPVSAATASGALSAALSRWLAAQRDAEADQHLPAQYNQRELFTVLTATLALVCVALSILAIFTPWMLLFAIPAIALSGWSMWNWLTNAVYEPIEFKNVAIIAVTLSVAWPLVWFIALHIAARG